jgi:hypothetical protein
MLNLHKLSPDEQKQLREYVKSIKEIKKEINELLNKANQDVSEERNPHDMSKGLTMNLEED